MWVVLLYFGYAFILYIKFIFMDLKDLHVLHFMFRELFHLNLTSREHHVLFNIYILYML